MRISFERSGGFAGMTRTTNIDTANLAPNESNQLSQLVNQASFFELPELITNATSQSDRFEYTLIVEDNGKQHAVTVSESAIPNNLKPLIDWLNNAPVSP